MAEFVTSPSLLSPLVNANGQVKQLAAVTQVKTFVGTVHKEAMFRRISDLVGLKNGFIVKVQHTFGTGLVRLGSPGTLVYQQDWENIQLADLNRPLDSWARGDLFVDGSMSNVGGSLIDGFNSVGLTLAAPLLTVNHYTRNLTSAVVPSGNRYQWRWRSRVTTSLGAGTDIQTYPTSGVSGGATSPWDLTLRGDGAMVIFDNAGTPTVVAGSFTVGTTPFTVEVNVPGTTTMNVFIDTTLKFSAAKIIGGTEPWDHMQLLSQAQDTAPLTNPAGWDTFSVYKDCTLASGGLLMSNGGGEEFQASLQPINLDDLALACDGNTADATVSILVVGT